MTQDDSYPVAWIGLARGEVQVRYVEDGIVAKFVGGKGLAAHILYSRLPAKTDPLGPENLIALLTGPLTGTAFPASSRSVMAFKSPATGTFSDSYCGGRLGPYLRRGGLRGLVIGGRAAGPVYLLVEGETIAIKPATHLWGLTTTETEKRLKNELGGNRLTVASIGPAGENMAAMANVMNGGRAYGRGGLGAVWGSKNLKAIVVRDGKGVIPKDEPRFKELFDGIRKRLKDNPMTRRGGAWNTLGTMMTLGVTQETGTLPTLNWRENSFDRSESVQADAFQPFLTGTTACFGCPIACGRTAEVRIDGAEYITEGPEYETMYAFGPNCGIDDPRVLVAANDLCSNYGLDTISTGVALSFAMECEAKGLLPDDGPSISFGDAQAVLEAIPAIAIGRPGYALLAGGVKKASESIPGSAELAIHVKGLELPGYDPRGMKGQSLCYALADRGGCHLRSSTLGPELMGHPQGYDRLSYEGKADLIARMQLDKIAFNIIPLCLFAGSEINLKDGAEAVSAVNGRELTVEDLLDVANRTRTLIRLFNAREGFNRADDTLPNRLFDEPSTRGHSCGETVDRTEFERLLTEYYTQVGWNPETGIPTVETVAELGLEAYE